MLNCKGHLILDFIEESIGKNQRLLTVSELARITGLAKKDIYNNYLRDLEARGYIEVSRGRIKLLKMS